MQRYLKIAVNTRFLAMEGIALTGAPLVIIRTGLVAFNRIGDGWIGTDLWPLLNPGDPVMVLMGPTGAPTEIFRMKP